LLVEKMTFCCLKPAFETVVHGSAERWSATDFGLTYTIICRHERETAAAARQEGAVSTTTHDEGKEKKEKQIDKKR
jgi:hypothetical protein